MAKEITYHCTLSEGIHARPAGHIARLCNTWQADIVWQNLRTGIVGSAKNALSLVATDTLPGDTCRITLSGPDCQSAGVALTTLLDQLPNFSTAPPSPPGSLPRCLEELHPHYLPGDQISAGIAIAPPEFISGVSFDTLLTQCPGESGQPEHAQRRLLAALETLRQTKERDLQRSEGIERDLLEAHQMLISDGEFQASIEGYLHRGMRVWSAVIHASMDFSAALLRSPSRYIQQRTLDILDIATQLLYVLYPDHPLLQPAPSLARPSLVFASRLTPSQLMSLARKNLAGLVISATGKSSHTAILARALNIPTLADIDVDPVALSRKPLLILDAEHGILITEVNNQIERYFRREIAVQTQKRQQTRAAPSEWPLLTPELIQWDLDAKDKNETIKSMVDNLWLQQRTDSRDRLCHDIWARETPFPTVVGTGFAIPHARTEAVEHSTISIARLRHPVTWGGVQVETVFMLSISAVAAENEHMRYFSSLARLLMNDEFVSKAKETTTPIALYNLIFSTLMC